MELDQFIESDIRAFLERERSEGEALAPPPAAKEGLLVPEDLALYAPSKDYASELDQALTERDIPKAKRLLQELKERLAAYPADAPERQEGERLLTSLYATFQRAVAQEPTEANLLSELQGLQRPRSASHPLPKEAAPPPPPSPTPPATSSTPPATVPSSTAPSSAPPAPPAPSSRRGLSEADERALLADIEQLETLLSENAWSAAIRLYSAVKGRIRVEELSPGQRQRILPRLSRLYERMHARLTGAHGAPAPKRAPSAEAARLRDRLSSAERAAEAGDLAATMGLYQEIRALFDRLPPQEAAALEGRCRALYSRILALRASRPPAAPSVSRQQPSPARKESPLDREERRLVAKP